MGHLSKFLTDFNLCCIIMQIFVYIYIYMPTFAFHYKVELTLELPKVCLETPEIVWLSVASCRALYPYAHFYVTLNSLSWGICRLHLKKKRTQFVQRGMQVLPILPSKMAAYTQHLWVTVFQRRGVK